LSTLQEMPIIGVQAQYCTHHK